MCSTDKAARGLWIAHTRLSLARAGGESTLTSVLTKASIFSNCPPLKLPILKPRYITDPHISIFPFDACSILAFTYFTPLRTDYAAQIHLFITISLLVIFDIQPFKLMAMSKKPAIF
jgi:hypothetical protein